MTAAIIIIVVSAIVFGIGPIFLRSSAVLIFLTLAAGELLSRMTSQDITQFVRSLPSTSSMPIYSIVQIALLLVVPLVILLGYRNSIKPGQLFFHFLPAVASVVICVMLVVAKLPYDLKESIQVASIYKTIEPFFSVAIAAGLLSSAMYLLMTKPRHHKDKKHKH
jgi:hypothetical protein